MAKKTFIICKISRGFYKTFYLYVNTIKYKITETEYLYLRKYTDIRDNEILKNEKAVLYRKK